MEKDYVELTCKVNAFNFSQLEWKWRPMNMESELIAAHNLSGIDELKILLFFVFRKLFFFFFNENL